MSFAKLVEEGENTKYLSLNFVLQYSCSSESHHYFSLFFSIKKKSVLASDALTSEPGTYAPDFSAYVDDTARCLQISQSVFTYVKKHYNQDNVAELREHFLICRTKGTPRTSFSPQAGRTSQRDLGKALIGKGYKASISLSTSSIGKGSGTFLAQPALLKPPSSSTPSSPMTDLTPPRRVQVSNGILDAVIPIAKKDSKV